MILATYHVYIYEYASFIFLAFPFIFYPDSTVSTK